MTDEKLKEHIAAEASTSLSFSNILLGIGLVVTGLLAANPPASGIIKLGLYASLLTFSSFFASIFAANIMGSLRQDNKKGYLRALLWTNAFTEYLGVYVVCVLFPIFVFAYSNDSTAARISALVVVLGIAIYNFSEFDLLSRWTNGFWHILLTIFFILSVVVELEFYIRGGDSPTFWMSVLISILFSFFVFLDIYFMSKKQK